MAFTSKIANLIKQSVGSNPTLYQAIRCMSTSKLFVAGLSYGTDEHRLKEVFAPYGQVVEARVIHDRESGRSRGFAFVTFTCNDEANAAMAAMNGKDLEGRIVKVDYARERVPRPSGGGFGVGGEGFGGGTSGNYGFAPGDGSGASNKFTIDATSSGGDAGNIGENEVLFGSVLKDKQDGNETDESASKSN